MNPSLSMPHPMNRAAKAVQVPDAHAVEDLPRYLRWGIVGSLVSLTLLSRMGINIGEYTVNFALPIIYLMLFKALLDGNVRIDMTGLLMYSLLAAVGGLSFLASSNFVNRSNASFTSLMLLAALYLPFVFTLQAHKRSREAWLWTMRVLLDIALLCGILGIVQFYLQFVFRPVWLFDISSLLPPFLKGSGLYNSTIPVGSLFKSNGIVFREPSGFSFMMAFAVIAELALFKRLRRVAVFGLALILSYSGTGLLAFGIGLMFPFGMKTALRISAIAVAGLLMFLLLDNVLNLSFTLSRLGEFGAETSSGYIRYIAPMRLINELIDSTAWAAFIGHGPGTIFLTERSYDFHDPTWAKLLFEYGLFGFTVCLSLLALAMRRTGAPVQISVTLFFYWLLMGGHLLNPECVLLIYVAMGLWPSPPKDEPPGFFPTTIQAAGAR